MSAARLTTPVPGLAAGGANKAKAPPSTARSTTKPSSLVALSVNDRATCSPGCKIAVIPVGSAGTAGTTTEAMFDQGEVPTALVAATR